MARTGGAVRKILLSGILLLACSAFGQNVRFTAPFPSVSSSASPFLVANLPPNSPQIAWCHSPANTVPCTNYSQTFQGNGTACPNGAQDTPDPNALTSACQSTGDAQGNLGVWTPAGTYDYTVCIAGTLSCFGPYTVTLGGSGGGGGGGIGTAPQQAIFSATNVVTGQNKPLYDVRDFGFVCNGTADNSAAATALVSAIGGNRATVQFPLQHCGINSFLWPANITLSLASGGTLKPLTDTSTAPGSGTFDAAGSGGCQSNGTTPICAITVTPSAASETYVLVCMYGFSSTGGTPYPPLPTSSTLSDIVLFLTNTPTNQTANTASWLVPNVAVGARTFTWTFPHNLVGACSAIAISGLGPSPWLDGAGSYGSGTATPMSSLAATFQSGSFLISYGGNDSNAETCTAGAGFIQPSGVVGNSTTSASALCTQYQTSSSAGTTTALQNISVSATNGWYYQVIGLRPGSAREEIYGCVDIPPNQLAFENATGNAGLIDFTGNLCDFEVHPGWWGAVAGTAANQTTNTAALQAAIHAAYGTKRLNGSGLNIYNKTLVLDGEYQINGELQMYSVHGTQAGRAKLRCDSGGIEQNTANLRIFDGQSVAYFQLLGGCLWQGNASSTNALIDWDYNGVTTAGDLAPQFIDHVGDTFSGSNLVDSGVLIAKSGGNAQGSNIYCWNCEGIGFTGAVWQIGGDNIGRNLGRFGATNAIDVGWFGGDMEGNPLYGISSVAGGSIFLEHVTMENGFSANLGPDNQTGFDMSCFQQIGIEPCIMNDVRSESRRLITAQVARVTNSYTIDQSAFPTPGGSDPVGAIMKGSVVSGDGQYYKITTDSGVFPGAGAPGATLTASGGSSTTLSDTNASITGTVTNGIFVLGETVTQASTGSSASVITIPQSVSFVTGSVASGTFTAFEGVTQSSTGATANLDGAPVSTNNMFFINVTGSPDASHTWTGNSSGATYTPTASPVFDAASPILLITSPSGSPDGTHTWTGATSSATYLPVGAPVAQAVWTTNAFIGLAVSVMSGTDTGCYGIITANSATAVTFSGGWLNKYQGLTCGTPDTTSKFFVECYMNGGSTVTCGSMVMAALNEKAIDGANGNAGITGTLDTVSIPGDQINVQPQAILRNVITTRPDWLPDAGGGWWQPQLDHDWDVHLIETVSLVNNTYYQSWQYPNAASGTLLKLPFQRNLGTVPLVWSAGYGGGLANVANDCGIGGRSDPFATNNASRNILEILNNCPIGPPSPVGTNQNGGNLYLQGGLPTGSGTPGNLIIKMAPGGGSSGSTVQTGANTFTFGPSSFSGPNVPIVASLTTTSATSDNVTLTGMTSSGHCQFSPTNASGATNYSTTYVSAKTTNQITITHAATSGMGFDIACTPN
jgi:hypothetical protein